MDDLLEYIGAGFIIIMVCLGMKACQDSSQDCRMKQFNSCMSTRAFQSGEECTDNALKICR